MKKEHFIIEFDAYEVQMNSMLFISKTEFKNQLKFLRGEVERTKDFECPLTEIMLDPLENDKMIVNRYKFESGCATTYLTHEKCKDGYCFKK